MFCGCTTASSPAWDLPTGLKRAACQPPVWPPSPAAPAPQESQALQTKQRELQAALSAARRDANLAAGQQERISALEAEVAQAQASAAAAQQQLDLAASRTGVLEKAYSQAQQVGGSCVAWVCIHG